MVWLDILKSDIWSCSLKVFLAMSILCLLFAEGLNYCAKDSSQEGFTMHQISRSHRRSVRSFRNTWLLLAQLCWLFLTDIPGQLTNSTILCQLCGALTHLFWMLFWFSTGDTSIYHVDAYPHIYDTQVSRVFFLSLRWTISQVSLSTTYSFLRGPFCQLLWWSASLDIPWVAMKRCACIQRQNTLTLQGVFESIYDWQDVPAVQNCHLWQDGDHLLAPTWLHDAAAKHSGWSHSPIKPHRALHCSCHSLSVCYIQVRSCFFNLGNIACTRMQNLL